VGVAVFVGTTVQVGVGDGLTAGTLVLVAVFPTVASTGFASQSFNFGPNEKQPVKRIAKAHKTTKHTAFIPDLLFFVFSGF
jgi:hypothetical protein